MEFEYKDDVDHLIYCGALLSAVTQLLKAQTYEKVIVDVYGSDCQLINKNYTDLNEQAIESKIVRKKKYVKVETIVSIKTKMTAYRLYMN